MRRVRDSSDGGLAAAHACALLAALRIDAAPEVAADHPALAWRRAGLMAVTGRPDGPGLTAPVALTAAADGALAALKAIAPSGAALPDRGAVLLGERARLLDLPRRGDVSPNGTCRLLRACDGGMAFNLPRPEDWDLLPALFGEPVDDWTAITRRVAERSRSTLLAQGRCLGLAIAADETQRAAEAPFVLHALGQRSAASRRERPLVVDLSGLWAGPLAASLLHAAGARVVKVESTRRPDGARGGDAAFYDLLNAGKASVALDFRDPTEVETLRRLVATADIVVESARPRALAALGIDAAEVARRGATWLSISAHGREGEAAGWIGFGDDAAVAGGLSAAMRRGWGETLFAGDAITDPLTGITAALAAWASWLQGGGRLVAVALSDVVAHACAIYEAPAAEVRTWKVMADADAMPLYPLRAPTGHARPLGADTAEVIAALNEGENEGQHQAGWP